MNITNLSKFFSSSLLRRSSIVWTVPSSLTRSFSIKYNILLENDIEFDELQQKILNKEITLIDNRTPIEANDRGMIPGAIVMPINCFAHNIMSNSNDFKEQFGVDKPKKDDPIVTMCKFGVRARTGQMVLLAAGFTNVRTYVGSFEEWRSKEGNYVVPNPPIKYQMEIEGNDLNF